VVAHPQPWVKGQPQHGLLLHLLPAEFDSKPFGIKAQFIKKINTIAMGSKAMSESGQNHDENPRIIELETRVAFLENTVDTLNEQLATLNQEFTLAHQALQLMNRRLESLQNGQAGIKDFSDETPPPHY
jgi:SlyX protein